MDKFYQGVADFMASYGVSSILILVIIFILYVAATKPENFKIYFGAIWHFFAGPFTFLRKKAIRFQIEGPLTKALKRISKEIPDMDIPDLQINWVRADDLDAKLREGKAIIKLKYDTDNSRNIIKATSIYVKDAFLINAKPYLSENFTKAIDLTVTKKILLNTNLKHKSTIIPQFINENKIESNEVFEKCEKIEEIDDNGLFTRVLLKELNGLGEQQFGRLPKEIHKVEGDEFLDFVYNIVIRDYDDNTPLVYNKTIFKVGFLLVAKADTYVNYGLEAYYRRIRLGLANGIKNFYLLARSEKVEILEKVANELIQTGNFILKNAPKEYIDNLNRKCICFSLEINSDSILATTLKNIGDAIKNKETIYGVITSVRENRLLIDVNGVSGEVKYHNLSEGEVNDARHFFKEGMDIELLPLEILEGGNVNFSLKNTKSDPINFVKSQFEIGKQIEAKVIYTDDNFIKLDIGNEVIEGIAFRKDLTYSKYVFLHKKFEIDKYYDFTIKDYDFSKGRLILQLRDLQNPWVNKRYSVNDSIDFVLMKRGKNSFIGEVEEGVEAIIPKYELGWTYEQQEETYAKTSLNSNLKCKIVNIEEGCLILSLKKQINNPYQEYFDSNVSKVVKFVVTDINEYGINGNINDLHIYIPKYEISWNGSNFKYYVNKSYDVSIKDIGKNKDKLIGSFKPILKHPLEDFKNKFAVGQVLKELKIKEVFDWGIVYTILFNKKPIDGFLLKKGISNSCLINDIKGLSKSLDNVPLAISEINLEQNRVILSLNDLTNKNKDRYEQFDYQKEYNGIVIGTRDRNKVVIIPNYWVEGVLESDKNYAVSTTLKVRPIRIDSSQIIFTDE